MSGRTRLSEDFAPGGSEREREPRCVAPRQWIRVVLLVALSLRARADRVPVVCGCCFLIRPLLLPSSLLRRPPVASECTHLRQTRPWTRETDRLHTVHTQSDSEASRREKRNGEHAEGRQRGARRKDTRRTRKPQSTVGTHDSTDGGRRGRSNSTRATCFERIVWEGKATSKRVGGGCKGFPGAALLSLPHWAVAHRPSLSKRRSFVCSSLRLLRAGTVFLYCFLC